MISSTTYQCWWRRDGRWRMWSRRRPSQGRSRTPSSASSTLPSWPRDSLNHMDSFEQITRNQPRCTRRRASQRQPRRGRRRPRRQWTSSWRFATLAPEHQLHHRHPDNHNEIQASRHTSTPQIRHFRWFFLPHLRSKMKQAIHTIWDKTTGMLGAAFFCFGAGRGRKNFVWVGQNDRKTISQCWGQCLF